MDRSKAMRKGHLWSSVGQRHQAEYARSHNDEPALRKTGIRVLGEMPWGTHICLFYETKKDLLDSAVSYFRSGLENNEYCVWAVSGPITVKQRVGPGDDFDDRVGAYGRDDDAALHQEEPLPSVQAQHAVHPH